jgi:phage terminase small subunit
MAKKASTKQRFTQKVHNLTRHDILTSVAVASILLNILFLITVIVLTNTDTFSRELYTAAREQYCSNSSALKDRVEEIGDAKQAVQERNVDCIGEDFAPFYNEALEKYLAQPQ